MKTYIAVDIGDLTIKYGLIDEQASVLQHQVTDTPAGGSLIRDAVLDIVRQLLKTHPADGVCISTAGMVDPENGYLFHAPDNMPDYAGTNWRELIDHNFGLPCEVESEYNCAGLAEFFSGAAMSAASCLSMTIGTGIGGCFIIDGHIWRGHSLAACAIGHLPMYGSTFGALASTGALVRKVGAIKNTLAFDWDGERIFSEAMAGDKDCIRAIDDMCDTLGRGISTICYIVNPEVVVLGGDIMTHHQYLLPRIRASMERYLFDPITSTSFIASASHGVRAGMIGAFYHFQRVSAARNG